VRIYKDIILNVNLKMFENPKHFYFELDTFLINGQPLFIKTISYLIGSWSFTVV